MRMRRYQISQFFRMNARATYTSARLRFESPLVIDACRLSLSLLHLTENRRIAHRHAIRRRSCSAVFPNPSLFCWGLHCGCETGRFTCYASWRQPLRRKRACDVIRRIPERKEPGDPFLVESTRIELAKFTNLAFIILFPKDAESRKTPYST